MKLIPRSAPRSVHIIFGLTIVANAVVIYILSTSYSLTSVIACV
ncbi:MAG: hypothetical protein WCV79_03270 [Candidatus Paceibacterota bacterium]